jgi:hypothetical protein
MYYPDTREIVEAATRDRQDSARRYRVTTAGTVGRRLMRLVAAGLAAFAASIDADGARSAVAEDAKPPASDPSSA